VTMILAAVQPRTQPPEGCKHKDDCLMTKVRSQDSPVFPSYCFSACELPGAINDPERK
jgi:hypothetical protein